MDLLVFRGHSSAHSAVNSIETVKVANTVLRMGAQLATSSFQ